MPRPFDTNLRPWYVRSGVLRSLPGFGTLVGPSTTFPWTYTVPTGKRALLTGAFCQARSTTLGGTNNIGQGNIRLTPSGGSVATFLLALAYDLATPSQTVVNLGTPFLLAPGDTIDAVLQSATVGATFFCVANAFLWEFDP